MNLFVLVFFVYTALGVIVFQALLVHTSRLNIEADVHKREGEFVMYPTPPLYGKSRGPGHPHLGVTRSGGAAGTTRARQSQGSLGQGLRERARAPRPIYPPVMCL